MSMRIRKQRNVQKGVIKLDCNIQVITKIKLKKIKIDLIKVVKVLLNFLIDSFLRELSELMGRNWNFYFLFTVTLYFIPLFIKTEIFMAHCSFHLHWNAGSCQVTLQMVSSLIIYIKLLFFCSKYVSIYIRKQIYKKNQLITSFMRQYSAIKTSSPMPLSRFAGRTSECSKNNPKQFELQNEQLGNSLSNKKFNIFLTQKKKSDVEEVYNQINTYIDNLDSKVTQFIQRNESDFVIAYRNHLKRVRQQMHYIKEAATRNANSSLNHQQKIESLQKQLIIFREESLKLFEKVIQRERTITQLQTKIKEMQTDKTHLQKNVKNLMRVNKELKGNRSEQSIQKTLDHSTDRKQFQVTRPQANITQNTNNKKNNSFNTGLFSNNRSCTSATHSQTPNGSKYTCTQFKSTFKPNGTAQLVAKINQKIDEIVANQLPVKTLQDLKQSIEEIVKPNYYLGLSKTNQFGFRQPLLRKQKQYRYLMQKINKTSHQLKYQIKKSEMQQLFYKCIEVVRKQIVRRKNIKNLNFYKQYTFMNFQEFKKIDYFRLLQILLSHQKIIQAVHHAIFQQVS